MREDQETIYITQNFRIAESMKRKIANYSKKMGDGNKSEFLRTAVNFLISYFEDKDFFEILEKEVLDSLIKYESKKIMNTKMGEYTADFVKTNLEVLKNIPGSSEKRNELLNKIQNEAFEEIKEKFDDFVTA